MQPLGTEMKCRHEVSEDCPDCLRAEIEKWNADARRLSAGLIAICEAPKTVGSSVLRSVAYDVALNCMDGETAKYQILRRSGIANEQNENHD